LSRLLLSAGEEGARAVLQGSVGDAAWHTEDQPQVRLPSGLPVRLHGIRGVQADAATVRHDGRALRPVRLLRVR
jgi:hypothetical protein